MFDDFIRKYAIQYQVPEPWIRAVISIESSWNPNAIRQEPQINAASRGLMQLLFRTAQGLGYQGAPDGLFDPETNIRLGTALLADLRHRYGDDVRRIISAYNSGRPDLWETSTQVRRHVEKFLLSLESWLSKDPLVATSGGAVLLTLILMWLWKRKG